MKKLMTLIGFLMMIPGCSIFMAAKAPSPVEYKKVQVGSTRNETMSLLGTPKLTENKGNQRIDTYEFLDGIHGASKARILLYVAGDIFTAGLAELIFWPLEANAFDGKQCRGTVNYNAEDRVLGYDIMDNKGTHLWTSAVVATQVKPTEITTTPVSPENVTTPAEPVQTQPGQ